MILRSSLMTPPPRGGGVRRSTTPPALHKSNCRQCTVVVDVRDSPVDRALLDAGAAHLLEAHGIIESYHGRGSDELVHRAFKDFVDQRLPFKGFRQNTAYYYLALLAFALFEAFKADVTNVVVPTTSYATTFRRKLIDVAGKIVTHAGKVVLKVSRATLDRLHLEELWRLSSSPPPLPRLE